MSTTTGAIPSADDKPANSALDPSTSNPASLSTNAGPATDFNNNSGSGTNINNKPLDDAVQESYSPWDMPPIIHPISSGADTRNNAPGGLKGFSNLNSTWPHFRSKPHPTISLPVTPTAHSRSTFDTAAPSTPPRNSGYSNAEDSDNAMCTPTFGSNPNYSRRNSAVSVMALDTPPPLSLMDLESSSSLSGSSFGSVSGQSSSNPGSLSKSNEPGFNNSGNSGYPFPPFGIRNDAAYGLSRRSSRTNSFSMESRHARKPSEDTHMSDGGNQSGNERSRRHSPVVVPFERSVRRSALLEEAHHNRHEYDHERETTQVRKETGEESLMDISGASANRQGFPHHLQLGSTRRPSTSPLNPEQELNSFQKQQEEHNKLYHLQQLQHLTQLQFQQQPHPHPLQATAPMQDLQQELGTSVNSSYGAQGATISSLPSSPLLAPVMARSKRKSSTCEERFDPYHSSQLKRRAVSPSIGPIISHRRSPSSSPARHLAGHSRSKITSLPSPSSTGSFFRHGHGPIMGMNSGSQAQSSGLSENGTNNEALNLSNRSSSSVSSTLNLQHTSRSFSELSLGIPKNPSQ
ncbi:hypothetical protein BGZ51_002115 [Haplosporangium sp. Z 767]|nr:hypothetical protein BGZ51_002115 [Haplosporangium sp. Z 767]